VGRLFLHAAHDRLQWRLGPFGVAAEHVQLQKALEGRQRNYNGQLSMVRLQDQPAIVTHSVRGSARCRQSWSTAQAQSWACR
jgi:hypothetical protein